MTPQDPDRILAHALGVAWDGPEAIGQVGSYLPPGPWSTRDRWWITITERWIAEAQTWYQRAEEWRYRCRLAWLLLGLTWAWVIWLGVSEWVRRG